jgi:hypothetical protein
LLSVATLYPLTDAAPHSSRGTDKPEGVAIPDSGQTYAVTDIDGVEDRSGETWFLQLGQMRRLFRKAIHSQTQTPKKPAAGRLNGSLL